MPNQRFHVAMTCQGCVRAVNNVLKKKLGDKAEFEINLEEQTVEINSDLPEAELMEMLTKTGKEVKPLGAK